MKDNFSSQSSERLKSERLKLGLSQAQAADLCGVSREIWGKYERGNAVPGGEVLFSFAATGADIQYILTGIRSQQASIEPPANYVDLNKKKIDKLMEDLTAEQQAELIKLAEEKMRLNLCEIELSKLKKQVG